MREWCAGWRGSLVVSSTSPLERPSRDRAGASTPRRRFRGHCRSPPTWVGDNQVSGRRERVLHRSFGRRSVVVDVFLLLFFLWALGPRRPRLGFGVLKDTFPIRWSPWARFLPVQLIRSAWQSAWHINFPRTRCISHDTRSLLRRG